MPDIAVRRLGVALLVSATVFTMGTAFAANINLSTPTTVGAGEVTISAPCDSVVAAPTFAYRSADNTYYVDTVVLTGTNCPGTDPLQVLVTLKDGAANPETTSTAADGAALEAGLTVTVTAKNVKADAYAGLAVLVTGP